MRTIRPVLAVGFLAILIAACGGAASSLPGGTAPDQPSTVGNGYGEMPSGAPAAPDTDEFGNANQVGLRDDARIIRTGSIQIEVSDVPSALRTARDAIVGLGGYVGASNTSNSDEQPFAEITYRIPANRWEDALDVLRSLNGLTNKVVNEQTQSVEVTGQIVDLQARIKNLRASETALQAIAANAVKVSDVLEVEARLTDIRGQIEQLTAQLVDLNDRAAFTTLTAYFSTPVVAVELASKEWEPATTVDEATANLISIGQNLANAGIWFLIVWVPVLLVLALLAGLAIWFAKRLGLRRRRDGSNLMQPPQAPGTVADTWR